MIIWIIGIIIGQEQTILILNPEDGLRSFITRARTIQVSAMLDFGEGRVAVYPSVVLSYGESVLAMLNKLNTGQQSKLYLTYNQDEKDGTVSDLSIGGYIAGDWGKSWLLWVNNVLQTEDISRVRLKARDVVELKYVKLAK